MEVRYVHVLSCGCTLTSARKVDGVTMCDYHLAPVQVLQVQVVEG